MAWTPKALIALANDLVMSVMILDEGSETRAAIQGIANQLISQALTADPTLAGQLLQVATQKVDEAIAAKNIVQAVIVTLDGESTVGIVDRDGKFLPGAQWDKFGRPTDGMMGVFANRSMLRAGEKIESAKSIVDSLGQNTWVTFAQDCFCDHCTQQTYIGNRGHGADCEDQPYVYPGNYLLWVNPVDLSIRKLIGDPTP